MSSVQATSCRTLHMLWHVNAWHRKSLVRIQCLIYRSRSVSGAYYLLSFVRKSKVYNVVGLNGLYENKIKILSTYVEPLLIHPH